MSKRIWITSLTKDEANTASLFKKIHDYGLAAAGHFWRDDLEKLAFAEPAEELGRPETAAWLVTGALEDFAKDSVRQGLALLALLVAGQRGHGFPIVLSPFAGTLDATDLGTPLQGAAVVSPASLGPVLAAKANLPPRPETADYRLRVLPMPGIGLWFEAGPGPGQAWQGALFGVCGADIDAHGVGPAGTIPQRAILDHPVRGMRLTAADRQYLAWGVANPLAQTESYFVRVTAAPTALVFGPFPQDQAGDLFSVVLR